MKFMAIKWGTIQNIWRGPEIIRKRWKDYANMYKRENDILTVDVFGSSHGASCGVCIPPSSTQNPNFANPRKYRTLFYNGGVREVQIDWTGMYADCNISCFKSINGGGFQTSSQWKKCSVPVFPNWDGRRCSIFSQAVRFLPIFEHARFGSRGKNCASRGQMLYVCGRRLFMPFSK